MTRRWESFRKSRVRKNRVEAEIRLPRACLLRVCLVVAVAGLTAGLGLPAALGAQEMQPASSGVVLDRVVAVVNNRAILASEVEDEIRLSVLEPGRPESTVLTPQRALGQLISRVLIEQQIRQEDERAAGPPQSEVDARLAELRKELPACVRQNCASDAGWQTFLAGHRLTPQRVEAYLRYRLEILRFIELRFRQGIRISQQEIDTYYRDILLPQYAAGEKPPALDAVAPRIEEILLQQQVNAMFDDWLNSLRKQGQVEVVDPAFESAETQSGGGVANP